jgi:hypothetical protein
MSNINVSFKNLEINVLDDEGVNILAYTVPEYQLSMNAKGMVRFIGELVEEVKAVVKAVEITNTSPDEESPKIDEIYYMVSPEEGPPKMGEIYYMVSENGINTKQWSRHTLDDRNWATGRATKDIDRATAIFKSLYLPS